MTILEKDFIHKELAYWNIPGVTIGICTGSEVLLCDGYGVRNLSTGAPMTGNTLGGIASCSKSFTSAVIGSLAEEGVIDIDKPVREYIPDFRLMDPAASQQCTLRDMLYHRTGLSAHDAMWPEPGLSPEEYVHRVRFLKPNRPFRSSAEYNNTVYALAGHIAAIAAGSTWEELVRERIFRPLGMKRSCLTVKEMRTLDDWAVGYFGEERESVLTQMDPWEMDIAGPAAGVNSSAREMLLWLQLHMNRGMHQNKRLFRPETMDELHRAAMDISAFPWRFPEIPGIGWYGMAWKTTFYRDVRIVYHCGEIEGYCSIELFLPDRDFGMYVLCNRHKPETPFLMELVYTAIDRYFGYPETDWAERLHPYENVFAGSCDHWLVNACPGEAVSGTKPSHPLSDYAGSYWHPGYGKLEIRFADMQGSPFADTAEKQTADAMENCFADAPEKTSAGTPENCFANAPEKASAGMPERRSAKADARLFLHYKKWDLPLEHLHYDNFRVTGLREDTLFYTLPLSFSSDALTGQIHEFTLPLDPGVTPIRFRRDPLCRHAQESDLAAVCAIYEKIHTLEEAGSARIGWNRDFYPNARSAKQALERGDLFVLETGGIIAAAAIINREQVPAYSDARWSFPCGEKEAMVLHTLVVDPEYTKKGLGSAFVRFYEAYASMRGCHVLRMDTNEINTAARSLYQELGYHEADIVPCTFNGIEGVHLVCLEKNIS